MIDSFHCPRSSSSFQTTCISWRISERIVLPLVLITSAGNWSVLGNLFLFSFSTAISTSKVLGSGTSGAAVYLSVCVTSLTPHTFKSWEKWFLRLVKTLWEYATRSLPVLRYIISRLVTLLKANYALIQVSNILVITVCVKFIPVRFRYSFFLLLKCLLASRLTLLRYLLRRSGSCNHCTLACFLQSKNFEHFSSNHDR